MSNRRLVGRLTMAAVFLASLGGLLTAQDTAPSPAPGTPTPDELLLFRPTTYPDGEWAPDDLEYQDVWFTAADGVRLHGWYLPHQNPIATVLHLHGSGGNLSHRRFLMKHLQTQHRLRLLIFDYRGYGRSEGTATVSGALLDAAAARQELARLARVDPREIVLMGHSLGGAIAIQLAAQEPPRALIVESSFSSLRDMATRHYPRLAWIVPEDKLNSIEAIRRYRGPYLQSHSDGDTLIPIEFGRRLFAAANGPKTFLRFPRIDHNDPPPPTYYQSLERFLRTLSDGGE